jgi:chemotaxis protein methyltransferase CheR
MRDRECVEFLQWCLPELRLRWAGFRKVRRQVCKRVSRRIAELGLSGVGAYRSHLLTNAGEWRSLDALCRVTISRFYRDRGVFDGLRERVLPRVARQAANRGADGVRCWCAGCGAGEEPYTVGIMWRAGAPDGGALPLEIVATDCDARLLERARTARYPASSVRDLPVDLLKAAFENEGSWFQLRESYRAGVTFLEQDIRNETPDGRFEVVFCRNLALTYFDDELQTAVLDAIGRKLIPGGVLVVGIHESVPPGFRGLAPLQGVAGVYTYSVSLPHSPA